MLSLSEILRIPVPVGCSAPMAGPLLRASGLPAYEDRPDECRECPNALKTNSTGQFVCAVALEMQRLFWRFNSDPDSASDVPVRLDSRGNLPQNLYEGTDLAPNNCPLRKKLVKDAGDYVNDLAADCEQKGVPFDLEKETLFITVDHPGFDL